MDPILVVDPWATASVIMHLGAIAAAGWGLVVAFGGGR